jgi:hypothetical protein
MGRARKEEMRSACPPSKVPNKDQFFDEKPRVGTDADKAATMYQKEGQAAKAKSTKKTSGTDVRKGVAGMRMQAGETGSSVMKPGKTRFTD